MSENISDMDDTLDTSHSAIGPCGLLEQSFFGDNLRHVSTALLSSALDTNAEVIADVLLKCEGEIGMCICARTTARIRWHVDKEHEKQDDRHPKTNESVNVGGLLYIYASACVSAPIHVHKHMGMGLPTCMRSHFTVHSCILRPDNRDLRWRQWLKRLSGCTAGILFGFFYFYFHVRSCEILNTRVGVMSNVF